MVDAMYKMILKQLWNERKGNLFIWLEMLVVSIFLWYAADALFVMYRLYSQPLGFNIEHTYHVSFGVIPEESPDYDTTSVHSERGGGDYLTLMDRIRRNPSVESICFTTGVHFHYRGSNQYATFRKDSLIRNGFVRFVSPTYFEVFGVKTAEGGSPSELVDALRDNQVVVTGRVADDFFGNPAAAVRQEIYITDQGSRDSVAYRIGGVCEKQRYCEFTGYDYAYYKLVDENKVAEEGDWVGEGLNTFIRVKPGADGAAFATNFRKEMEQQLRVGNIYLKDVFPMSHYRDQFLERWLDQVRLYVAGIAFFLLNVLLGVVGTFWYRTQQRSADRPPHGDGSHPQGHILAIGEGGLGSTHHRFHPLCRHLRQPAAYGGDARLGDTARHGLTPVVRLRLIVCGDGRDDCRGNQFSVLPGHADASGGRLAAGMIRHGHLCSGMNRLFDNGQCFFRKMPWNQ